MASPHETDFKDAVNEVLNSSGTMPKIQAQVRAHIVQVLEGSEKKENSLKPAPDTYLLNELIREYLDWQGYAATSSVFCKEGQLAEETFPRSFLEARVGINSRGGQASRLPVLYSLLRRQERDTKHSDL